MLGSSGDGGYKGNHSRYINWSEISDIDIDLACHQNIMYSCNHVNLRSYHSLWYNRRHDGSGWPGWRWVHWDCLCRIHSWRGLRVHIQHKLNKLWYHWVDFRTCPRWNKVPVSVTSFYTWQDYVHVLLAKIKTNLWILISVLKSATLSMNIETLAHVYESGFKRGSYQ